MNKFASIEAFTQVVKSGGFAAAARKMGLSRSTVNKLVIELERELQVQLLQRTTRKVHPTTTGLAFYERCLNILAELEAAELAVSLLQTTPKGTLRLNAPMSFGTLFLGKAIADFAVQYPELQIQLTLDDRFIEPIAEGYDVTVRIAQPQTYPNLVYRPIAPITRVLCTAPSYLDRHGLPDCPEQLKEHSCLHYGQIITGHQWHLSQGDREYHLTVAGALCANNGEVLKDAAIQGLGIALLPMFMIEPELNRGELDLVLPEYQLPALELGLIYPLNRHLDTKIKLLVDFMEQRFAGFV
ncbi:MAG: LysR family transcriptional regulator [Cyanobacteria bacterium J06623_7]